VHLSGNSSAGSYRDPSSVGTHSAARRSYYKTIGSPHFDATPEPSTSLKEFCAAPLTFIASGELHVLVSFCLYLFVCLVITLFLLVCCMSICFCHIVFFYFF
jgi:hypothetical protein